MSIFRSRGFDSLIGKGSTVSGEFIIAADTTLVIDGVMDATVLHAEIKNEDKVAMKTTLHVNGMLTMLAASTSNTPAIINVPNVIIAGKVTCDEIRVEGTLAIKAGAQLKAKTILYRSLIIETGAVVHGQMCHLDHVSQGEIV